MTLEEYRKDYYSFSTKASELSRQLSFAGIALIWLFKLEKGGPLDVPATLLLPAFLFCLSLALDLAHAVIGTIVWGAFARQHERKGVKDDAELDASAWLNWPALVCFWGKLASVFVGYVLVLSHIAAQLRAA
jgi:hypothetical protein